MSAKKHQKASEALSNPPDQENKSKTDKNILNRFTAGYIPYLLLLILSFVLYGNTLSYQYALDDEIVICRNDAVLKGIAGAGDIFSKDLFSSYYNQNNATAQLSGGRYRPLSVFSFAVEQEFIGTHDNVDLGKQCWDTNENGQPDPKEDVYKDSAFNYKDCFAKGFALRHFDNVFFYGLACCALFLFLSQVVFKEHKLLALIISLLFIAHPLHTEVVANVKSRDEIFSFLFMMLTLYFVHRYDVMRQVKFLLLTLLCFFCAMLSKEYGVLLFVFIPLSLYLFSGNGFRPKSNTGLIMGMVVLFGVYYFLRSGVVTGVAGIQDKELLNNPYLLATTSQAIATKLFISLKYLLLCLFPYKLCSDYGYNSIPYKSFASPEVWLSIAVLAGIIIGGIIALMKKHWLAFAIAFYGLTLLLVTNIFFNVGATMGERLAFHASLGYCMVLGFGILWVAKKAGNKNVIWLLLLPVLLLYSVKTISRNKAWENDNTLSLTDIQTMPESAMLNGNVSKTYIDLSEAPVNKGKEKEYFEKSIFYGQKAIHLHPGMGNAYINLGLAYARLNQFDSAIYCLNKAFEIFPHHPNKKACYNLLAECLYQKGNSLGAEQKWQEGIVLFNKAVAFNPDVARYWYDLGGYLYNTKDFAKAKEAWTKAYQLDPNDKDILKVQQILK